jgi:hypothetical protein
MVEKEMMMSSSLQRIGTLPLPVSAFHLCLRRPIFLLLLILLLLLGV